MANLTVRNIPDSTFEKIRLLSEVDRRSLNSEILIALEKGARAMELESPQASPPINAETQAALWYGLCGSWKDAKSKERTIREIYGTRSFGREVSL